MKTFILSLLIYLLLLIIPVMLLLKLKDKVKPLDFLKLTVNVWKGVINGVVIGILFVVVLLIKKAILGGGKINLNIGILWVSGFLVGILEEIPFRGYILQKLNKKMNFWSADIVTSIIFVSMHIPIWIISGMNIYSSAVSVFFVSIILGYLFEENESLWVPIICHSVFNLCIWTGLA